MAVAHEPAQRGEAVPVERLELAREAGARGVVETVPAGEDVLLAGGGDACHEVAGQIGGGARIHHGSIESLTREPTTRIGRTATESPRRSRRR
jgi:hypothetical protein